MPSMDGIEFLQKVAKNQWAQHLIVMSAQDASILDAVECMASEDESLRLLCALPKPLSKERLEKALLRSRWGEARNGEVQEVEQASLLEIRTAIETGGFVLHYQPKVDVSTGLLCGVEALARWNHPEKGLVMPGKFIPALENSLSMRRFTMEIMKTMLADLANWRSKGVSIKVAVNMPTEALLDTTLADKLANMAREAHVPPQMVILEVTESMVMKNLALSIASLARMRLKGFGLAMDDYGVGYASMQQLSRCPFTELKIDRMFVDGALDRPNRRVILESAIEIGKRLGITTVAEGVESEAHWRLLQELGCDVAQGYFFGKPMPANELMTWKNCRKKL